MIEEGYHRWKVQVIALVQAWAKLEHPRDVRRLEDHHPRRRILPPAPSLSCVKCVAMTAGGWLRWVK